MPYYEIERNALIIIEISQAKEMTKINQIWEKVVIKYILQIYVL